WLRGKPVRIKSPSDAIAQGIGMIHQHFRLVPAMTVAENVVMGVEPRRWGIVLDHKRMREQTQALSQQYGLVVNPDAYVAHLSVGLQQRVEILKALYRKADLLILDEPTALLTPQEVRDLFEVIRRLRDDGKTVLFISHKLKEVMEISDRVTALRDGRVVGTVDKVHTSEVELARMMVGRDVFLKPAPPPKQVGDVVLRLEGVNAFNEHGIQVLKDVSLEVRSGEILGLAGIDGNGQSELVRAIIGLQPVRSGRILLDGCDITNYKTSAARDTGIGVVPEDRLTEGLVLDFRVDENLCLGVHSREPFARRFMLDWVAIQKNAARLISRYDIRPPTPQREAKYLSGGNQQKIIVAREIS
ncbi:MAG: ATP-binding cassette domain-containing protein, partial [Chloroflexi bacterium]|nr:ATP-binding cassette domain-containing protein [Chloroflexota bacterium]